MRVSTHSNPRKLLIVALPLFLSRFFCADGNKEVDIFDIVKMATIYGFIKADSSYDPNCDVDGDGDMTSTSSTSSSQLRIMGKAGNISGKKRSSWFPVGLKP